MAGAQSDPGKWFMPGWRIEEKYSNRVLIGNWAEDRLKFERGYHKPNSTQRIDFVPYPNFKPDVIIRKSALKRGEGIPTQHLFSHHGLHSSNNLVSSYDENFNKRVNRALPPLRTWDGKKLAWVPERSDYPLEEPPTNFGLLDKKIVGWTPQTLHLRSTYTASYTQHPRSSFLFPRYTAVPRNLSSNLYPPNNVYKNMQLKEKSQLQVPDGIEGPSTLLPSVDIHT
ncbi:uncharacterized protein C1orf158 homolog [Protopterus annectens]|uniref:uncharacterized protein C1orf158 homolog n=1 Tax=Protopterus annectens TaxID=7888 RepID=UPI001CF9CA2C|nr:uncharacterized protein C1orf158 homolog [Protopterus annectens]